MPPQVAPINPLEWAAVSCLGCGATKFRLAQFCRIQRHRLSAGRIALEQVQACFCLGCGCQINFGSGAPTVPEDPAWFTAKERENL